MFSGFAEDENFETNLDPHLKKFIEGTELIDPQSCA